MSGGRLSVREEGEEVELPLLTAGDLLLVIVRIERDLRDAVRPGEAEIRRQDDGRPRGGRREIPDEGRGDEVGRLVVSAHVEEGIERRVPARLRGGVAEERRYPDRVAQPFS